MKYNKYKNKWTKCNQKHNHQSRLEAEYCNILQYKKKKGEILDFNIQVKFELFCNDVKICNHIVDFLVKDKNNNISVYEIKGKETRDWKIKKKLFEAQYMIEYNVIKKDKIFI